MDTYPELEPQGGANPIDTFVESMQPPPKRGPGRPPGSGKKPDLKSVPKTAPPSVEDDDEDMPDLSEEEAMELMASAVNLAFSLTKLTPPLTDKEASKLRPHAKPVLDKYANVLFKRYRHEIGCVIVMMGPITLRLAERRDREEQAASQAQSRPAPVHTVRP